MYTPLLMLSTFSGNVNRFRISGLKLLLSELLTVPIPMSVRVCLLGLVDEVVPSKAHRTLLDILLFYARKAILLHWKKAVAPTLSFWKGLVNSMMPFYKATYVSRGCGKKM